MGIWCCVRDMYRRERVGLGPGAGAGDGRPQTPCLPLTSQPGRVEAFAAPWFSHLPTGNNCTDLLDSSEAARLGTSSAGWSCQVPRVQLRGLSTGGTQTFTKMNLGLGAGQG